LAGFEAAMPLLGFLAGSAVGSRLGDAGEWVAIAVLGAVGAYMLAVDDDDLASPGRMRGWALLGVGLSVSMDELAIGLAVGLAGLPILLVVVVIAAQAFVATQLGSRLGARLGARLREGAERAAGALLVMFAAVLLALRLTGHAA
jgi:putative Mn2+ efflux pump MntP